MTIDFDALFCEDIRQEANGKFILVGVFAGSLLLASLPATIRLGALVRIWNLPAGAHQMSLRIFGEHLTEVKIDGDFENTIDNETIALAIPPAAIQIGAPTAIMIEGKIDDITFSARHYLSVQKQPA
ncbi:hypothetical protein GCM10010991_07810 [Gemmobacter aquaticus]|uniref:Uncharacterized protein n=1 Tax=Gemmobacter aquaticus TaxID=490185 RepID=A0A918DBT7_9RHOB|nr:hypothetical protein [Gemmobacter aquaticus]GGO26807.1 hypothetical protein GCM10010991_07810 [Gemmobacter aquaticus]